METYFLIQERNILVPNTWSHTWSARRQYPFSHNHKNFWQLFFPTEGFDSGLWGTEAAMCKPGIAGNNTWKRAWWAFLPWAQPNQTQAQGWWELLQNWTALNRNTPVAFSEFERFCLAPIIVSALERVWGQLCPSVIQIMGWLSATNSVHSVLLLAFTSWRSLSFMTLGLYKDFSILWGIGLPKYCHRISFWLIAWMGLLTWLIVKEGRQVWFVWVLKKCIHSTWYFDPLGLASPAAERRAGPKQWMEPWIENPIVSIF